MRLRNIVALFFTMLFVVGFYASAGWAFEVASWLWTPIWILAMIICLIGFMMSFAISLDVD